ncbi:hypothetical protein [Streptomyces malaysiensis]|uniref:Uncharacterized protein n=1 Tax=Streptomyces malaysiensis TaxID=92644 RepID=A0A2J7Z9Q5_STRMQ|nr:hypothetical protein [Streptomyces malaysiensis]PNG97017.1 hypothetical protein SMF913_13042 [Streptomyces malaysiensis]
MSQKEEAVREAAIAVLEHGGPACLTDPKAVMRTLGRAYDLGATQDDVIAEMKRVRAAGIAGGPGPASAGGDA